MAKTHRSSRRRSAFPRARLSAFAAATLLLSCNNKTDIVETKAEPEVSIQAPVSGQSFGEGESIVFVGKVVDDQDGPEDLEVSFTSDIDGPFAEALLPDSTGRVEVSTANLSPGNHAIQLVAVDLDGMVGSDTIDLGVLDLAESPTLEWARPNAADVGQEGEDFEFVVVVDDAQDDPEALTVVMSSNIDKEFCAPVPDAAGDARCLASLSVGEHILTATVIDLDGNEFSAVARFVVVADASTDDDEDGWTEDQGDCDDADPSTHPGADEFPNGIDDDCNDLVDDGTGWFDDDGDCYCEDTTVCTGSIEASCTTLGNGDCDDADVNVFPGAEELCNLVDDDCDGTADEETTCFDDDGDGYTEIELDCDDSLDTVYPGAPETADGADNDCDGTIDEGTAGFDDDGDCWCDGSTCTGSTNADCASLGTGDCNDGDRDVHPSAAEECNGLDDDCDGTTDEADAVDASTWFEDADRDGYGDAASTTLACAAPAGYVENDEDCDDTERLVFPDAPELCDGVDNNCDGTIDEAGSADARTWYLDVDGDTYGDAAVTVEDCAPPSGYTDNDDDCDDRDAFVNPAAEELCNGVDDDCDGDEDEDDASDAGTWYFDGDRDGYGLLTVTTEACEAPAAYVGNSSDCDDGRSDVNPAGREVCDGVDQDCDGTADDGVTSRYYADADRDGYGGSSTSVDACSAPSGYVSTATDCNDGAASVYPGAPEYCNDTDDDCDGAADETGAVDAATWYADGDSDGYGDASRATAACDAPAGYVGNDDDCNDRSNAVSPAAAERCNGTDDDCDGTTDEADATDATTWYADADRDSYGDATRSTAACSAPSGYVSTTGDCNDTNSTVYPGAPETCDSVDQDCDGTADDGVTTRYYADADRDGYGSASTYSDACSAPSGYVTSATDCDDGRSAVNPAASEYCNGYDDDCDSAVDEASAVDADTWYRDSDSDGYGDASSSTAACSAPSGYVENRSDCNDRNGAVNPAATERCDSTDNDCDGSTDESDASDASTWYRDADSDGHGSSATTTRACTLPSGYVSSNDDCDDTRATVYTGATEYCNSLDDDCDGTTDESSAVDASRWYTDSDRDGYGTSSSYTLSCSLPSGYSSVSTDCNDSNAGVNPGAAEVCDSVDQDCDGATDEGVTSTYYRDADSDGYGTSSTTTSACSAPSGYVASAGDCNDGSNRTYPGAAESCDSADNDCDGSTDEGVLTTYYRDADSDGYGTSGTYTYACSAPSGYVSNASDCNDGSNRAYPGATESCDGIDNDCDSSSDEVGATGCSYYYYDYDGDGYGNPSYSQCACGSSGYYRATNSSDCYDSNSNARPTATSYYTSNRGDGSYDYNCDGAQSKYYNNTVSCSWSFDWFDSYCYADTQGWNTSNPACGSAGNWASDCDWDWSGVSCAGVTSSSVTQACR